MPGLRAAQRNATHLRFNRNKCMCNCSLYTPYQSNKVMDNFDRVCNITNAMRSDEAMERYAYIYRMKGGDIYSAEMAI